MAERKENGTIQDLDLNTVNVFELINTLGDIRQAEKVPTNRYLNEHGGEPVISLYGCTVYSNGYVRYERDGKSTIMWLPDCTSYTCWFVHTAGGNVPDKEEYDLSAFPWMYAVMLRGDARLDVNMMTRGGDRIRKRPGGTGAAEGQKDTPDDRKAPSETINMRLTHYIPGPEETFILRETIREILRQLSYDQRELLLRYYYDGYTLEEIGQEMGISASAVLKRIRTICENLQMRERMNLSDAS